jgi:oligopeptide/dipeptide ABC transporter ATP-binding protein
MNTAKCDAHAPPLIGIPLASKSIPRMSAVTLSGLTDGTVRSGPLLQIQDLRTYFYSDAGPVKSVDGVSFEICAGETLAVVGESGSGKSVTSLSAMGLIDSRGQIVGGSIFFRRKSGTIVDITRCSEDEMRRIRGNEIAMVFQEPMTSLNPAFTAGDQIVEAIMLHQAKPKKDAWRSAAEMLTLVGIPDPEKRLHEYPHQMSGGMRQRVMIAMALSSKPSLLIADEPTTALDVTIQAQILDLMRRLQAEFGMAILLITHNLGVVAEVASRVAVMYAGRIVEQGSVAEVFQSPKHPYTAGLLGSIPRPNAGGKLTTIPGSAPNPSAMPPGCSFAPRCTYALAECSAGVPVLARAGADRLSRCIRWRDL